MPGYKHSDVGVIPDDWDATQLGGLVRITSGASPSLFRFTGNGVPYFKVEQLSNSEKYLSGTDTPYLFERGPSVPARSVVFAKRGAAIALNKVRILNQESFMDTNLMALTPQDGLDWEYLFYALGYIGLWRFADTTSVPQINNKHVKPLAFPVPTVDEQRAIAKALSDADELLATLDQVIAKKRDLKQATMQQLLTGKTRLPGFSGEWEVKRLGDICELKMGRTPPRLNPAFWGEGYVWLSIADLQSKLVSSSKEQVTEAAAATMELIPKGTLLMSFKLSIGRLCFAGCDLFTNEAICSFNSLTANADYLYYALERVDFSLYGKQAVKGYTLNKKSLKTVKVTLPTAAEQAAIAKVLSDMDAELSVLESRRDKTRNIKQAMMQELLTGKTRLV